MAKIDYFSIISRKVAVYKNATTTLNEYLLYHGDICKSQARTVCNVHTA
jgi:hypothetical protein